MKSRSRKNHKMKCFKDTNKKTSINTRSVKSSDKKNIQRIVTKKNSNKSYNQRIVSDTSPKMRKFKSFRSFRNIQKNKSSLRLKKNDFILLMILFITLFMCLGYAEISGITLNVSSNVQASTQDGVFITNIEKVNLNSESKINYYLSSMYESSIVLQNDSSASESFEITVYNKTDVDQVFIGALTDTLDDMLYDNENIEFTLTGLEKYQTSIAPGQYLTFTITYKYKDGADTTNNVLNNKINFRFREMPKIVLQGITTELVDIYPDYEAQEYSFKVDNFYDENNINHVPSTYKLKVTVDQPLTAKIYDTEGNEVTEETIFTALGNGTKETHNYTLKIFWDNSNPENDKAYNSIDYANKEFTCDVELIAIPDKIDGEDKYLGYTLNKELNLKPKSIPMYFETSADNTSLLTLNYAAKFNLTVKNNDGVENTTNYNIEDTKYKISIDNENLLLKVDGNLVENNEFVLSSDEIVNKVHEITLVPTDVTNIPKVQECNIIIDTVSPYIKSEKILLNITHTGILKPTDDPADTSIDFSTTFGTIEVIWLKDRTNVVTEDPNPPEMYTHLGEEKQMKPVTWTYHEEGVEVDGAVVNWTEDETPNLENWYNYRTDYGTDGRIDNVKSMWANGKNADGSYFVWIPRYAYRITYYSDADRKKVQGYYDGYGKWRLEDGKKQYDLDEGVEFIEHEGKTYIVHPVFIDDTGKVDSEGNSLEDFARGGWDLNLTGFWVGKYEASRANATATSAGSGTTVKTHPGVLCAVGGTAGHYLTYSLNYDTEKESHMVKMSEWGAVAYLAESQFGRNAHEVSVANSYIAGNASDPTEETSGIAYNTIEGAKVSTTGNVYGVYGMSGGRWEYVAGYNRKSEPLRLTHNNYAGRFASQCKDAEGNYISTKYATAYDNESQDNISAILIPQTCKVGDGTKEVMSVSVHNEEAAYWYNDFSRISAYTVPVWGRGGASGYGDAAGLFYSDSTNGGVVSSVVSFRMALGE